MRQQWRNMGWSGVLLLMCGVLWSTPALASGGEGEDGESKSGEVVREGERRVVSRKVVSRTVVKKGGEKKKASKKTRRRGVLVVDPSAAVASEARGEPPAAQQPAAQPARAATAAAASTAPTAAVEEGERVERGRGEAAAAREGGAVFSVEALTEVPLQVGAGVLWEAPQQVRLRLRSSLGVMPRGYILASGRVVQRAQGVEAPEAEALIEAALERSLVWRSQLGWRPIPRRGLYIHAGYTRVMLGGEVTGEQLIAAAAALDPSYGEAMGGLSPELVALRSTLHLLDAELGWEFKLGSVAHLRLGAGWSQAVRSRVDVDARFSREDGPSEAEVALFEEGSAQYLSALYGAVVRFPTVNVALGLRF